MNFFFNPENLAFRPKAVLQSKMLDQDLVWVSINPQYMFRPDWNEGAEARHCGSVIVKGKSDQRTAHRCYESDNWQSREAEYVMHGTSIKAALEIT